MEIFGKLINLDHPLASNPGAMLEILYRNIPRSMFAVVVNVSLFAALLWDTAPKERVVGFVAALIGISLLRLWDYHQFRHQHRRQDNATWQRRYAAGALITALLWAMATPMFFFEADWAGRLIIGMVVVATAAGAILSLAANLQLALVYLFLLVLPYTIAMFTQFDLHHAVVGASTLLYTVIAASGTRAYHHTLSRSLRSEDLHREQSATLASINTRLNEQTRIQKLALSRLRDTANSLLRRRGGEQIRDDDSGFDHLTDVITELVGEIERMDWDLKQDLEAIYRHVMISKTDLEGRITYVNDLYCEISGYSRDELTGNTHRMVNSGHHDAAYFAEMWRTIKSGQVWQGELRNRTKHGAYYWVAATVVPIRDEAGRITRLIAINTDITFQKEIQEESRSSRRFLQSLTESMGEGVYALDRWGYCTFLNPKAEQLLGWSPMELSITQMHDTIHYEDRDGNRLPASECKVMEAMKRGETYVSEDQVFISKEGRRFPVAIVSTPILEGETLVGSVTVFQDITERKETEQRLNAAVAAANAANQAKSTFLANMSHEIRTPLNAILGMIHLALQQDPDHRMRNYLEKAQRASDTLLGLINGILDFSKIEAGKMELDSHDFLLREMFDDLASVLGHQASAKGLELLFEMAPDTPDALHGDSLRLRQVLLNLCNNAIKFTERGEVVVSVRPTETDDGIGLHFSIRDTGIGMTEEQQERLFSPFTQANTSTTRRYGGTGLGLAISHRLVELMQGRLWSESTVGEGTTFHFTVHLAPSRNPPSEAGGRSLDNLRVLLVDDSSSSRAILGSMLEGNGIAVEVVEQGDQVLTRLEEEPLHDLLLLDWPLPGLELSRIEAALEHTGRTPPPALLLCGCEDVELCRETAERHPFVRGVLTRPVTPGNLVQGIGRALGDGRSGGGSQAALLAQAALLRGSHLLLVEDNSFNQEVAQGILEGFGITLDIAENGREALDLLDPQRHDGVLMDCQMPVMDGYTASREIRRNPECADIPIIAMTASALLEDRSKALDAGMNDYVAKPIDINHLLATLVRWILPARRMLETAEETPNPPAAVAATISAATVPNDDDLHLDSALGQRRIGGDPAAYRRLLEKFVSNQGDVVIRATEALDRGDRETAQRLMHTLKSTAGTIGAHRLQELAAAAEQALRQGKDGGRLRAEKELADELSLVLERIDTTKQPATAAPGSGEAIDLEPQLKALLSRLEEFDPEAEELLQPLLATPLPPHQSRTLREIASSVEAYDFERASERLRSLLSETADDV